MKPFPIPVVALGPGAHSGTEDTLDYLPMPSGMDTFALPRLPDEIDPAARDRAVDLLLALAADLARSLDARGPDLGHPVVDLAGLERQTLSLVNDALGQGEVSARILGAPLIDIQETIFAGIWRVQERTAAGELARDRLEACAMPAAVIERALAASTAVPARVQPPPEVMNAPAVLAELIDAAARHRPGAAAHVINLTLLPMTAEDLAWLGDVLGIGPVAILSRGYGNCRITSTSLAHTWWVQYFNSADTLILNTLEVTDLPEVALAAADDLADSVLRLREWTETLCEA